MKKEHILSQLNFKAFYADLIPSFKVKSNGQALGLCPFHNDHNPSLSVNIDDGKWKCFACGEGGDVFSFYGKLNRVDFKTALEEIAKMQGISEEKVEQKVVATFTYQDTEGKTLYIKERLEPGRDGRSKEFRFKSRVGEKLEYNRGGNPILYNLSEVIKSKCVIIAEGEGKVDLLKSWGLTATCLDSGANSKWSDGYTKILEGKKVVILPDNDAPGKSYASKIANVLHGKVGSLKVVNLEGLGTAEDIVDWAKVSGNDKTKLVELIKVATEWTPEKEALDFLGNLETWTDIQNLDIKVEWIVDRLIPKESITVLFGKGGIGKTWLLMDIARCIGSGLPFCEHDTIKTKVFYIDFENPIAVLNERTRKLGNGENVYFWRTGNTKVKPPKLDRPEWELYKKMPKGSVLVFDTLRASQGRDENASDQMGEIMGRLKELRDMGFTIILLHHTAKNSDKIPKGSTAIVDLADHILGLTKVKKKNGGADEVLEDDDSDDDETVFRFGVVQKSRYDMYQIYLTLNPDRGFELAPDPQEETLKEMYNLLLEYKELKKTAFVLKSNEKGLGSKVKIRKLVDIGAGRYWNIESLDKNNAQVVKPKNRFFGFPPLYRDEKPENHSDAFSPQKEADHQETHTGNGFSTFSKGSEKTEKPTFEHDFFSNSEKSKTEAIDVEDIL